MDKDLKIKMNIIGFNMELEKINYLRLEASTKTVSASVTQKAEIVKVEGDCFVIRITRKVKTEPTNLFDLELSVLTFFTVDEETMINFKGLDMKEYIDANLQEFIENSNAGSILSLLISQITSTCGALPLISPPFIKDEATPRE